MSDIGVVHDRLSYSMVRISLLKRSETLQDVCGRVYSPSSGLIAALMATTLTIIIIS